MSHIQRSYSWVHQSMIDVLGKLPLAFGWILATMVFIVGPYIVLFADPFENYRFCQAVLLAWTIVLGLWGSDEGFYDDGLEKNWASILLMSFVFWPSFFYNPPSYHVWGFAFYSMLATLLCFYLFAEKLIKIAEVNENHQRT